MPRADIDPGLNDAGMRQGQEFLQQPQFLHDLQRRGVHRVAAEIAQEFAMLLQHRHIHARRATIYGGDDYSEHANTTVLTIAQIETLKGLHAIDEIASVPGLDMLYLGPNDMRLTMGMKTSARIAEPEIIAVCEQVVAAAKRAGIRSGMFCTNVEDAQKMLALGFDHVTAVLDDVLLAAGAAMRKELL